MGGIVNKTEMMRKIASSGVERWGLPKERLFPLQTKDHVKTAAARFDSECENMTPSQRVACARNICARADEFGIDVGSSRAHKYASDRLSPLFRQWMEMRKEATCHLHDRDLDKIVKMAEVADAFSDVENRVGTLDKIASVIEQFDRDNSLRGHWGAWMPDPAYTVFGPVANADEDMRRVVKIGSYEVSAGALDDADMSRLDGKLEPEIVAGLRDADDRLAVFSSLPMPHKEIIYQNLFVNG